MTPRTSTRVSSAVIDFSMHPVRPLKNNDESDRRSERCEEMNKEVMVDGMDTKVSPIPEQSQRRM